MTESLREVWARAAAATIARQDQLNIENKCDGVYLPHFKVRYGQIVIAEALAGVTEEDVVAYVEDLVRGNIDVLRCKDIPVLLPDVHGLQTNEGAVIIRNALKRECDLSTIAQEKEWAKERLEDAMYREYKAEKEAALAGLNTARVATAGDSRPRSLSPGLRKDSTRRADSPRRVRSLSTGGQVMDTFKKQPVPSPLDDEDYEGIFIAKTPESSPSMATRQSGKEPIAELACEDCSNRSDSDMPGIRSSPSLSSSTQESYTPEVTVSPSFKSSLEEPSSTGVKIYSALSSSDVQAAPTPPLTPLRMSPPSSSNETPSIEPLSLDLEAPSPPPPPRTSSLNPLGPMFNAPLDKRCVAFVVDHILCSERVMNYRRKAKMVLTELDDGCIQAETLEWIIRGLRSPRAKREMAQRLHGLEFLGPQWGAPMYKTGKGLRRLLKGVASKHEAGARFVICASSSCSDSGANNVPIITGVLSPPSDALTSDTSHGVQPVMDGEVPGLDDWVDANMCGNLDDGCRLWAWVY